MIASTVQGVELSPETFAVEYLLKGETAWRLTPEMPIGDLDSQVKVLWENRGMAATRCVARSTITRLVSKAECEGLTTPVQLALVGQMTTVGTVEHVEMLADAIVKIAIALGITDGTAPITGPEVLLMATNALQEIELSKLREVQAA